MKKRPTIGLLVCALSALACSTHLHADITGQWKAEFDTQIGVQKYTYTLKQDGEIGTGKANSEIGGEKREVELKDGKLKDGALTFFETFDFQGNAVRIDYTGKVAGDEIKFRRKVGDFATEELVAKRVNVEAAPTTASDRPRQGRDMPSAPKPGPCPLPALPVLPTLQDTAFYTVRDVPHGKIEQVNYKNFAGAEKRMHIYLPPAYEKNETVRYPVLYLNHGGGDDDSKWSNTENNGGHSHTILDNLIAEGKARPMIIVMPNTRGIASANPPPMEADDARTQEYLKDIIPYVDSHYRTQASREHRALAGLSMGGFVVMHTGLPHLDTFSELYVYSSGHFTDVQPKFEERFATLLEDPETNNKFRVPFYMAQGETDIALRNGQGDMAIINKYGLRNFWVLSTGGHEWANWRRYLQQTAQIMFPDCDAR